MSECTAPLHHSSLPLIGGIVAAESLARSVSLGEEATQALLTLVEMLPSSWPRQKLTQALATHALLMAGAREFDISSVRAHLVAAVDPTFRAGWWLPSKINDTSLDFYAAIGLQDDLMSFAAAWRISGVPIDEVLLAFVAQPDRTGLLRCGLAWLIAGEPLEQDTLSVLAQDDAWTDHRWAQTILRICTTDLSREQALALANDLPSIIAACATPTIAIEMLLGALEKRAHVPTLLPVLIAAGGLAASARWELLADAEEIKHRYLLAHPTEIATLEPLSPTAARTSAD